MIKAIETYFPYWAEEYRRNRNWNFGRNISTHQAFAEHMVSVHGISVPGNWLNYLIVDQEKATLFKLKWG